MGPNGSSPSPCIMLNVPSNSSTMTVYAASGSTAFPSSIFSSDITWYRSSRAAKNASNVAVSSLSARDAKSLAVSAYSRCAPVAASSLNRSYAASNAPRTASACLAFIPLSPSSALKYLLGGGNISPSGSPHIFLISATAYHLRTAPVVQWLRPHLAMVETRVRVPAGASPVRMLDCRLRRGSRCGALSSGYSWTGRRVSMAETARSQARNERASVGTRPVWVELTYMTGRSTK